MLQHGGMAATAGGDALSPTYSAFHEAGLSPSFSSPKIAIFEIRLDSDSSATPGLYCNGQCLNAIVHLQVKRPLKATCIIFHCEGKVRLGNRTRTEVLCEKYLFGSAKSTMNQRLAIGVYDYPVTVQLPNDLLPTVNCKDKYVTYRCRATVKRILKKHDIVVMRPLTCHHRSEAVLDAASRCQGPLSETLQKSSWELACTVDRGAYAVGDTITVRGEVYNKTNSKRKAVVGLEIVQVVRAANEVFLGIVTLQRWCQNETLCDRQLNASVTIDGKNATPFVLQLPACRGLSLPTTSHPSVDISYKLRVTISCQRNIALRKPKTKYVQLPIVILSLLPGPSSASVASLAAPRNQTSLSGSSMVSPCLTSPSAPSLSAYSSTAPRTGSQLSDNCGTPKAPSPWALGACSADPPPYDAFMKSSTGR